MTADLSRLSAAERRVLVLLAEGHTAKSIAAETGMSVHAVNERLREARAKTGAGSSRELARLLRGAQESWDKQFGVDGQSPPPQQIGPESVSDRPTASRSTLVMSMISLVLAGGALLVATQGPAAPEAPPRVVATSPADGATVAPGPFTLRVTFDRPMRPDSYSFVTTDFGPHPDCSGRATLSSDGRTYSMDCRARAHMTYAVGLNYGRFQNFVARDGAPATAAVIRFASR